jgi:Putative Ig domain
MAIKINHQTEALTPETGVLAVNSTGALKLPSGIEVQRPLGAEGLIRYAKDLANPEYHDGTNWKLLVNKEYVDSRIGTSNSSITDVISSLALNNLTDVTISNPVTGELLVYDTTFGQFRNQTNSLTPITRYFSGDGVTLEFNIETSVSSPNLLVVSINGITQEPYYSYTVIDGVKLSFDEAPAPGDRIQVRILRSNTTSDRPRPKIREISYSTIGQYTTITVVATDITYGTGAKIGDKTISRIDYPMESMLQLMINTNQMADPFWSVPQNLTLVDTSGNEYTFKNLINYGASKPKFTDSTSYIGRFRPGDSINFPIMVNNSTSTSISPAYDGDAAISWLSVSSTNSIVGTAPNNSSPSRYDFTVTASNGSVNITKNYWLLVI